MRYMMSVVYDAFMKYFTLRKNMSRTYINNTD